MPAFRWLKKGKKEKAEEVNFSVRTLTCERTVVKNIYLEEAAVFWEFSLIFFPSFPPLLLNNFLHCF